MTPPSNPIRQKLTEQYSDGDVGPFGGRIQWLAPTIRVEWLDNNAIEYITLYDLTRTTIDALVSQQEALAYPQFIPGYPQFSIVDGRPVTKRMSAADLVYSVNKMKAQGNSRLSKLGAYLAFLIGSDVASQLTGVSLRALSGLSKRVHVQTFYAPNDALKWQRMNVQRFASTQATTSGSVPDAS